METPSAPSAAGPARRSRRLQGTPATARVGHTGSATTATGSPYARRPPFKRDSSSQTLAALESGGDAANEDPQDGGSSKLNRRKSVGSEGILGRFRRGLGWLVGRNGESVAEENAENGEKQNTDEERALTGSTVSKSKGPAHATPATLKTYAQQRPLISTVKRDYRTTPSIISSMGPTEDETLANKKIRSSHSTLNLPTSPPRTIRQPHSSAGTYPVRGASPTRAFYPGLRLLDSRNLVGSSSKASIFPSGPFGNPAPGNSGASSRRSVSPGAATQIALQHQSTSATSSAFGLESQSPFRSTRTSARSPDLAALNISSGLARSPSLPAERLLNLQRHGPRLYPYQRSPSALSGLGRQPQLPTSASTRSALGGKRDYGAMSTSPPKASPTSYSYTRATPSLLHHSPIGTDFGSDYSHRSKRQRFTFAWQPEQGFMASDEDGKPLHLDEAPRPTPKNEAERIMERLESIRRPQIEGLRSTSPRRINVPLPTSTTSSSSIFATRISSSRTEPSLSGRTIAPYARRQQAFREERAARRDIVNSRGGLGEHLRMEELEKQRQKQQSMHSHDDDNETEPVHSDIDATSTQEMQDADDQDALPLPTPRRTRQRTRELSVMSDASAQDEPMVSPRRSTRARREQAAPAPTSPPPRERKSAKSPPPNVRKTTTTKSKRTPRNTSSTGNAEMEEARPASSHTPQPPQTKDASRSRGGKSSDTPSNVSEPEGTIDQVISTNRQAPSARSGNQSSANHQMSAREERLSQAQGKKSGIFSAKEDLEDLANFDEPSTGTRLTNDQPKLKLPSSVFANRFSFGRSPSSSLLASPAATPSTSPGTGPVIFGQVVPQANGNVSSTATQQLPKLSLPSAIASVPGEKVHTSVSSTTAPSFSFSPTPQASTPASFAASTTKPLFSFKAPEPSQPAEQAQGSMGASESTSSKSTSFSFGATRSPSTTTQDDIAATVLPLAKSDTKTGLPTMPSFTFGQGAANTAPTPSNDTPKTSNPFAAITAPSEPAQSAPASKSNPFAFGSLGSNESSVTKPSNPASANLTAQDTKSSASTTNTSAAAPFSFGKPSSSAFSVLPAAPSTQAAVSSDVNTNALDTQAVDKPVNASFPSAGKPSTTPSFSFGKPAETTSAPAGSPAAFSFGQASATHENASRASSPFGGASGTVTPSAFGGAHKEDGSKAVGSAFAFGAPKSDAPKSGASGAAPSFSFGATGTDGAKPSTPAFSFGANTSDAQRAASPAPFAFGTSGSSSTLSTAAPSFGAAPAKAATTNPFAAASSSMQPTGSAFGSNAPTASPSLAFGQNTAASSTPAFSFGAPAPQANGQTTPGFAFGTNSSSTAAAATTPGFSFGTGASGTSATQPFSFGSGSATTPAPVTNSIPSFNFSAVPQPGTQPGSPAGTPTGAGPPGGSFFTMGAGDGPTSPNKARRPVKPLRRPR